MKKFRLIIPLLMIGFVYVGVSSCRKKDKGNCYCKFYSGDKTHYDLTAISRSEQEDSCKVIDNNASNFGGSCKLK